MSKAQWIARIINQFGLDNTETLNIALSEYWDFADELSKDPEKATLGSRYGGIAGSASAISMGLGTTATLAMTLMASHIGRKLLEDQPAKNPSFTTSKYLQKLEDGLQNARQREAYIILQHAEVKSTLTEHRKKNFNMHLLAAGFTSVDLLLWQSLPEAKLAEPRVQVGEAVAVGMASSVVYDFKEYHEKKESEHGGLRRRHH